jgi:RNA polymerase sigma-70 factor (ECF subfamily)
MRLFLFASDEVKEEFTPTTWNAFWQTAVEGRTSAAVAADLGLSVGAVYIARCRVMARIKKRIERMSDDTRTFGDEHHHATHSEPLL